MDDIMDDIICSGEMFDQWLAYETEKVEREFGREFLDNLSKLDREKLNFGNGFKIFSLENYQITVISQQEATNFDHERKRLFLDREDRAHRIYTTCHHNLSTIHIIDPEMPDTRLVDCLHRLSRSDVLHCILQVMEEMFCHLHFRPDNLYIGADNKVKFNPHIPNDPSIPFLLGSGRQVEAFHLHRPLVMCSQSAVVDQSMQKLNSFGWLVWILLEGSGEVCPDWELLDSEENWFNSLNGKKFQSVPPYLKDVMSFCWRAELESWEQAWPIQLEYVREKIKLYLKECHFYDNYIL